MQQQLFTEFIENPDVAQMASPRIISQCLCGRVCNRKRLKISKEYQRGKMQNDKAIPVVNGLVGEQNVLRTEVRKILADKQNGKATQN